jgi:hypothetical protein
MTDQANQQQDNQAPAMTEAEQQDWIRKQYQVATKFLAEKGLITESVADKDSRYLVPLLAVWKMNLADKSSVWVICGDLPTDFSELKVAKNARDAIRHFSLKWQMQAENLLTVEKEESEEFAQLLISRAEGLFGLAENEQLWQ